MNKLSKTLLSIIVILIVSLVSLYIYFINNSKNNFKQILLIANSVYETNKKVSELEKKFNETFSKSNSTSSKIVTNTSLTPNTENISSSNKLSEATSAKDLNQSPEKVTIKVIEDTISQESAYILITDNNTTPYDWGASYNIQIKENDDWKNIQAPNDLAFIAIAYSPNENNQLLLKVDYGKDFGPLTSETYRIVKSVYDNNEYIDLYSNEFTIN